MRSARRDPRSSLFDEAARRFSVSPVSVESCRLLGQRPTLVDGLIDKTDSWKTIRRLLVSVHTLLLGSSRRATLAQYYRTTGGTRVIDGSFADAFQGFLCTHRHEIGHLMTQPLRTTDPICAARLVPAMNFGVERWASRSGRTPRLPLDMVCLGAAAGLELVYDMCPFTFSRTRTAGTEVDPFGVLLRGDIGEQLLVAAPAGRRVAIDTHPIDLADPTEANRLLASALPEDTARIHRTRHAIDALDARQLDWFATDAATALDEILPSFDQTRGPCVVHGGQFLCSVPDPISYMSLLTKQRRDILWITDEVPSVNALLAPSDKNLATEHPSSRSTCLWVIQEGTLVEAWSVAISSPDGDVIDWRPRRMEISGQHQHAGTQPRRSLPRL